MAAGAAIGIAFACRYSEAIFLVPIFAVLAFGRSTASEKRCQAPIY